MSEYMIPIPSRVYNAAVGGHVAGADQIIDDKTDLTLDKVAGGALEEKEYTSSSNNGMGRVVLRKNLVKGVNTLTQNMINKSNTIYVIQYDFTLGENITVPKNCVLEFDGGSIDGNSTYKLIGKFSINDVFYKIFNNVVFVTNQTIIVCDFIRPEWFGAKGDFNPTNNTGTDDSAAISAAIRAAEILNVGKVKFSSSNYLVVEGVHIKRGNIWLDGVRALLREEQWNSTENSIYSRGSTLYCPAGTSIITCDASFADPFRCTNIQFECYDWRTVTSISNTHAINFTSEFQGPTWPFIVEYCHFKGFNRAIYFNSPIKYCVSEVRINNNGFNLNNWCVCFAQQEQNTANGLHSNLTWSFQFEHNNVHDNVCQLDIHCSYGLCLINDNNMEGNHNEGSPATPKWIDGTACTEEYLNKIGISSDAKLEITNNHFESINLKILSLEHVFGHNYINIFGNNVRGVYESNNIVADITCQNYSSNKVLDIKNIQFKVNIIKHGLTIFTEKAIKMNLPTGIGETMICSNEPFVNNINEKQQYNGSVTHLKNINGITHKKVQAQIAKAYVSLNGTAAANKDVITIFGMYAEQGIINVVPPYDFYSFISYGENVWLSVVFNIPYKYIYKYARYKCPSELVDKTGTYGTIYASPYYINGLSVYKSIVDKESTVNTDILFDPKDHNNIISNFASSIPFENLKEGDCIYDKTNNKYICWNGTAWVDAMGNTI